MKRCVPHGEQIKARILKAGLELWPDVTARAIGRKLELSHSAVLYHFHGADALKAAVAQYALHTGNSKVIVQMIGANHPFVTKMSPALRAQHMASI